MRLKRLVSAVLAVGMALTILPTAAFAALPTTQITGICLKGGMFDPETSGGKEGTNGFAKMSSDDGASWGLWPNGALDLNGVFSEDSVSSGEPMNGYQGNLINNRGKIASGKFADGSIVYNSGLITGGVFDTLNAIVGGSYTEGETAYTSGAYIRKYDATGIRQGMAVLKDSVVWGMLTENTDKDKNLVLSGVLPAKSEHIAPTSKHYEIEAPGFTMTSSYTTSTGTKYDFSIQDEMQVIGEAETPAMDITIVPSSSERKVEALQVKGLAKENYTIDGTESVTLHVPEGYEGEIEISSVMEKFALEASGNLPTKSKNADGSYGGTYDGWYYEEITGKEKITKQLTIYSDYTADIGSEQVDWNVVNNGTVAGGKYTGPVANYGNITGGTFADGFANYDAAKYNNTNAVREEGIVTSGVFSRSADFGTQNVKLTWLNVKNGTINNIDKFSMASVVGEQKVTVKPNFSKDLFRGWTYSGNISNAVAEQLEKQKNNYEMTLTLDGDAEDSINLMPMIDGEPFSITMLDGKASVGEDVVTAVVPGQTVTLSIDDSEIPAGMSFDHWVVNPADVELEGGFDAASRTTSFTMPAEELTIYASLRTDSGDDGTDAMTVVAGVAVGAGVAALTYHIGTELYAEQVLGKGVVVPTLRGDVARKAWELAGKPAVTVAGNEAPDEDAQAQQWVVDQGLMKDRKDGKFHPEQWMSKLKALRTLDAAKKLG